MMGPAELSLVEHVRRLRHDLGKYVSLQVRWLGPEPAPGALREALCEDVLRTRRGPTGVQSACEVWGEFRARLLQELPMAPEVVAIEAAVAELAAMMPALAAGDATDELVADGVRAAMQISDATRGLLRRAQESS